LEIDIWQRTVGKRQLARVVAKGSLKKEVEKGSGQKSNLPIGYNKPGIR
jgi:hypothetical protein